MTIKSLDPDILLFNGVAEQTLPIGAGGSVEVRFDAAGRAIGRARVQMTVKLGGETDAFEDVDSGRDPRLAGNRRGIWRSDGCRSTRRLRS